MSDLVTFAIGFFKDQLHVCEVRPCLFNELHFSISLFLFGMNIASMSSQGEGYCRDLQIGKNLSTGATSFLKRGSVILIPNRRMRCTNRGGVIKPFLINCLLEYTCMTES